MGWEWRGGDTDDSGGTVENGGLEDLFRILGNGTRIRILQTMWREFDFERYVTSSREPMPFSELRERAAVDDSGNFNYHLDQLVGPFLESRDGGYVLTPRGYNVMRSITEYTAFEYRTIGPTALDDPCPFCGGTLVASYEREFVHVGCRDCTGIADGNVTFVRCPAVDVTASDVLELLHSASLRLMNRVRNSAYGYCGGCTSRADTTVQVCPDHAPGPDGRCDTCHGRFAAKAGVECHGCGGSGVGPLVEHAIVSPTVESFFAYRGHGVRELGPWGYRLAALRVAEETVHAADPVEATVEFALDDDGHRVVVTDRERGVSVEPRDCDAR